MHRRMPKPKTNCIAIADALDEHAADIEAANALDMLDPRKTAWMRASSTACCSTCRAWTPPPKACAMWPPCPIRSAKSCADTNLPNGLRLTQTRVPMGVISMIYEARPNVTVDVASLCLKSGNAALLRGGHAAERTNAAALGVVAPVLEAHGSNPHWCNPSTSTDTAHRRWRREAMAISTCSCREEERV